MEQSSKEEDLPEFPPSSQHDFHENNNNNRIGDTIAMKINYCLGSASVRV